jgi:transcriptional regulator with XRE-family HTH domain
VADAPPFSERVKRAHRALELREGGTRVTLGELGQRLGRVMRRKRFSTGAVSEWESGNRTPDVETMAALAVVLGVRAEWLAFGTGPMEEPPRGGGDPPARDELGDEHQGGKTRRPHRHKSG